MPRIDLKALHRITPQCPIRMLLSVLIVTGAISITLFSLLCPESTIGSATLLRPYRPLEHHGSREAYALYLPTSQLRDYFENGVMLTLFGLLIDAELRDPTNRDVVVIVTNLTTSEDIRAIEAIGAKVFRPPYLLQDIMPSRAGWVESYQHLWDKLWILGLEEYDRVLYLDADTVFNKAVWPVWDEAESQAETGLAATADGHNGERWDLDGNYLNSGFMMVRPNLTMLEEITRVDMGNHPLGAPDQDLLNYYFRRDGPYPWTSLDHKYVTVIPDGNDIKNGVYVLHTKGWRDDCERNVRDLYYERQGRRKGWQMARAEENKKHGAAA